MLARRALPERYLEWNSRWGAPFGHKVHYGLELSDLIYRHRVNFGEQDAGEHLVRALGPFALQTNTSNRRFEYPWVHEQLGNLGARRVLDIGGGVSGLQFVLAQEGAEVTNVDPGEAGFNVRRHWFDAVNRVLGTAVRLHEDRLQDVPLADHSFDAVICISTLEHIDLHEIRCILRHVRRILRPGGHLILTVDLFPNLVPFTRRERNEFGTNAPVWKVLTESGFDIVSGEPTECFSAPGFDPVEVLSRLEEFAVGEDYPALVQALVARPD